MCIRDRFLASRALGPIDRITRTAQRIGGQDLSERLHLSPSSDEVGRLAATFDQMLDRLQGAFQRERQFTADASHELRTPLAMLAGHAELALERTRRPAEYRQALHDIVDDAARLRQLLSELLMLARAEGGREDIPQEPVALNELALDVVEAMTPLAEAHNVTLGLGEVQAATILGDQTRLNQLLINLVDNAIKYTPAGGHIQVAVPGGGGWTRLTVADTGLGIPAEHLPHVFERFYRVDAARARAEGGSGLGLSIADWIARAHGGRIEVASTVGVGTTFTVWLPLAPATQSAA